MGAGNLFFLKIICYAFLNGGTFIFIIPWFCLSPPLFSFLPHSSSLFLLRWEYLVTFIRVLTIYHNWTPPSIILLYSPSPYSWNSFSRSHFSIYRHEYTIFPLFSPSYTLSLCPPPPTGTNSPDKTYFAFLFLYFCKKNSHFCMFKIAI
jgi:hypothetical protein